VAGNGATIKGAQLTCNTVIGAIGGNLLIQSEQAPTTTPASNGKPAARWSLAWTIVR
jgi:hypothetical protein